MNTNSILIVDDSKTERDYVAGVLSGLGYSFLFAENGPQAIESLKANSTIALVILDVVMPGQDGLTVLNEIRRLKYDVAVIMNTSKNDFEFARTALRYGADDYLVKPIDGAATVDTVQRLIKPIVERRAAAAYRHRIFLSYAREDTQIVKDLALRLRRKQLSPWLDTSDLVAGEEWMPAIERAISESTVFIACLSKNSIGKRGIVQRELRIALDARSRLLPRDIYLIPLRLDDCPVPAPLDTIQWIDYFAKDGWKLLLESIKLGIAQRG